MNILIIHDSEYGNTNTIAQSLIDGAINVGHVESMHVKQASAAKIKGYDVIIVGSPTQGGRPTQDIHDFIQNLPNNSLKETYVAAFDTRFAIDDHGRGLRLLMKTIGFAAPKISIQLQAKGGTLLSEPVGFVVKDKTGPLQDDEIERAKLWIQQAVSSKQLQQA